MDEQRGERRVRMQWPVVCYGRAGVSVGQVANLSYSGGCFMMDGWRSDSVHATLHLLVDHGEREFDFPVDLQWRRGVGDRTLVGYRFRQVPPAYPGWLRNQEYIARQGYPELPAGAEIMPGETSRVPHGLPQFTHCRFRFPAGRIVPEAAQLHLAIKLPEIGASLQLMALVAWCHAGKIGYEVAVDGIFCQTWYDQIAIRSLKDFLREKNTGNTGT